MTKNFLFLLLLVSFPALATDFYNKIRLRDTTTATSVTNGAMRIDGGLSVAKNAYFGDSLTVAKSGGPAITIQDTGGAMGTASSPLINWKDSSSTVASMGFTATGYDLTITNFNGVGGFAFKQGSTTFLAAGQNGDWLMPFGLGLGTGAGTTTNIINARKDQNSVTRATVSNQNAGSGAYARITASADAGDVNFTAQSTARGAAAQINADSGFTGGLELGIDSTNPIRLRTNGSTRVTIAGSSGEAQIEKPIVLGQSTTPSNPSSGYNKIYPKSNDKIYALSSGGTESELLTTSSGIEPRINYLHNSGFDYWQRGTPNLTAGYMADRWKVTRSAGSPDCGQSNSISVGTTWGMDCFNFDTQSGAALVFSQPLSAPDSALMLGKTVSLQAKIKAKGNVNQVRLAITYTSGTITITDYPTRSLGTTTASISTGGFTTVDLSNVALGNNYTPGSGIITVQFIVSGVSSGNVGDINNGMIIEQAMLVIGGAPSEYKPRFASPEIEFQAVQAFYEKSYAVNTTPGNVTTAGATKWSGIGVAGQPFVTIPFKTTKRVVPTVTLYNCRTGASGNSTAIWDINTGSTEYNATAPTNPNVSQSGFNITTNSGTPPNTAGLCVQWTADAEISP